MTEGVSEMFSRHVTVDLARSAQVALDATGRTQNTDAKVVAAMPRGQAQEKVFFFVPRPQAYRNGLITDDRLEEEFDFFGLKPASPYSLAKANEDDPAFAYTHPNGTHFKDAEGNWCYAAFDGWGSRRGVRVRRSGRGWLGLWWFAGVHK